MKKYGALYGHTGILAYEIGSDFIKVQFVNGAVYLYNSVSAGIRKIRKMQQLAIAGRGLATYISQQVKDKYAERLR